MGLMCCDSHILHPIRADLLLPSAVLMTAVGGGRSALISFVSLIMCLSLEDVQRVSVDPHLNPPAQAQSTRQRCLIINIQRLERVSNYGPLPDSSLLNDDTAHRHIHRVSIDRVPADGQARSGSAAQQR